MCMLVVARIVEGHVADGLVVPGRCRTSTTVGHSNNLTGQGEAVAVDVGTCFLRNVGRRRATAGVYGAGADAGTAVGVVPRSANIVGDSAAGDDPCCAHARMLRVGGGVEGVV